MNRALRHAVAPLLVGIGLLLSASALQFSLLAVRAESEGFADWVVPVMSACYFAAFLAGSRLAPRWIDSVGHVRTFSAMASLASVVILVQAFWVAPLPWILARIGSGICIAVMVTAVEAWLNAATIPSNRGVALSWYMVVMQLGFVVGPLLIGVADTQGVGLFAVASILLSLSLVPVLLVAADAQLIVEQKSIGVGALFHRAPVGLVAGFVGGLGWSLVASMLIVVGLREGFSAGQAATIGVAGVVGAMLAQVPIGRLSDRVDRRVVIAFLGTSACAVGVAGVALVSAHDLRVHWVLAALLGATTLPAYGLGVAHVGDVLESSEVVEAAATLVAVSAVGSAVGPLAAAAALGLFGTSGVPALFAVSGIALGMFSFWRLRVRPTRPPTAAFVPVGARTTALGTALVVDESVGETDVLTTDAPPRSPSQERPEAHVHEVGATSEPLA